MLEKLVLGFTIYALAITTSLVQGQSTAALPQNQCVRPNNVLPVSLDQIKGIWYLMQTTDNDVIYKNLKCVRGQIDDHEVNFQSNISQRVCNGRPTIASIGVARNFYLISSIDKYENILYLIVEQEPGVFDLYTRKDDMVLTIYILKIVPSDVMIFSCCFKKDGNVITQIYKYYTSNEPRLDKQKIADAYEELGIQVTHNKYISQFEVDCINETYY